MLDIRKVEIFDRRAHKWRPGPSMLNVRSGAGVTVYDKKIIAVGGHKGAEIHRSAEILIGDEWIEIANMSIPRRNTAAAALNGLLYAVGGDDGSSNLSTIECIQLSERSESQWKIVDMEDEDAGESSQLNESFGNKDGLELLEYERATLAKTLPASVLFVVASGLGLERLFLEHLILFSDRRLLAIVLNTNEHDESYFVSKLKEHSVDCDPKVINSDVSVKDRQSIYLEGGVQFCSSRVLLVDLLQNRIPTDRVAAIFVYRAHQTLNAFQDSFILRLYREKKPDGMVKAFTDVPNTLSSLGQLQRLVDRLYVRHVELLPRFSNIIETELNKYQLKTAIFSVDVPTPLRRVHRTLIEFIKVCVRDLRTSSLAGKHADDQLEEMVHVPWASTLLEKRLRDRRGNISEKQQRLLNDVASLREILQLSENMDVATVLSRLQVLKNDRTVLEEHSGWLLSPSFNRIMEDLLTIAGVTNGKGDPKKFSVPAKWTVLTEVLREIKNIQLEKKEYKNNNPSVLIITSSEDLSRQVTDVVRYGMNKMKWMTWRQLGYKTNQEMPDDDPLWDPDTISQLMRSSLDVESKSEVIANVQKSQKTTARAAQKRRKHAEEMSGFSSDSRIQTSLIQFGILQYKRRKSGNEVREQT
ncbi:hypothetical protein CRE_02256 [Caenorhabditis remanei]|uniref:Uncharacterized protein n=1 Tax=Caenorhabditis remanei TaxID=31234 RepID=E3LFX2_CAERE|nr:hypothetical protein CRE_02256 [Caenorhabditis remanei]